MARKKQNKLFVVKDVVKANSIKEYKEKCNTYNLSKREKAKELSLTWGKTIDPLAWMERTSSELAMTWDSVGGLEGINSALKDNYGNIYGEFKHVATTTCDDYYIDENGKVIEPNTEAKVIPGMDKIWNSPFSVYIQRVIDLDDTSITHVSKIGKTIHSVNDREHKGYNPLGRSSSHSETEKHYKDTLRAGYIIEWYCINIPVQYISTVDLKNSVSFIHGKSPDIVESELREILKNRTGKKCLENIKPSDMPK